MSGSESTPSTPARASRPTMPDGYGIPESDEGLLLWSYVVNRLEQSINYWISTVDEQGRPHATPVWGVWQDGMFYFDGSPQTRRGRNLAGNPAVVVHLEDGSKVVILHGDARELKFSPLALRQKLAEAYSAKYSAMDYQPGPEVWENGGLWEVRPRKAFAWTQFPADTTRFTFED